MSAVTAKFAVLAAVGACLAACATSTQQPMMFSSGVGGARGEGAFSSPAAATVPKDKGESPAKYSTGSAAGVISASSTSAPAPAEEGSATAGGAAGGVNA